MSRLLAIFCFLGSIHFLEAKTIRFIPWWKTYSQNEEFFCEPREWPPIALPLKTALNKLGFEVTTVRGPADFDKADFVIAFHYPFHNNPLFQNKFSKLPKKKKILFLWETPIYLPNAFLRGEHHALRVFTWDDQLLDNKGYAKLFYPSLRSPMREDLTPFNERKLLTLVSTKRSSNLKNELQSTRNKLVDFFECYHPDELDVYGKNWPLKYRTVKGFLENKIDHLNKYKFYVCYENSAYNGYITEKIFDCFYSGCIPVYYGAPDIEDYIPKTCFIDRRSFKSNEELYQFLKQMSESSYNNYLANIREFLASKESLLFSVDFFVHRFLGTINPFYNRDLVFTKEQQADIKKAQTVLKKIFTKNQKRI